MKKFLLTDIDGVVLDYDKTFAAYLLSQGLTMSYVDFWTTLPFEETSKYVHAFNHSHYFESIDIFSDAVEVLPRLADEYELVAITSCGTDPLLIERRKKNLEKHGLRFSDVICLDLNESKHATLQKYPPSIWVEDQYKNAVLGKNVGHQTFLRKDDFTPSEMDSNICVIQDWFDIEKYLFKNNF